MSSYMYGNSNLFPENHKTVFVLDHTPYFGISCESPIEFEFLKTRTPGFIPINPISKSLWTCSAESALEYCRIVWDLFPQGKLVRFFASDTAAHVLNTWNAIHQNLNHIMNGLSFIGTPPPPTVPLQQPVDYTVVHGLRAAVEALAEPTEFQRERLKVAEGKVVNTGRVICITSARDNDSMKRMQDIFYNCLLQQNKMAVNERLLPIDHCHFVIIHTFPINIESKVSNQPTRNLSSLLSTEVHSVKTTLISSKLSTLILNHYNLASTTVTGIPMKEEQNASSSANYDVEIYHSHEAHTPIFKGNASEANAIRTLKEGLEYETVTLKWCTPRGCTASELQNCISMFRITPVDVNSRPSLCLINFLLNGRSVMLEMPRKTVGKINSHLLASHGGEIFIHTLCTARSVLEDPPSVSEGCGGRVTDYRINDFGILMQQNRLVPSKPGYIRDKTNWTQKLKMRLNRHTKYWPLIISSTFIFNLRNHIDPLPEVITKEKLTEDEVAHCKQVIYNLVTMEAKHEPLNLPNLGQRTKNQKREEQYKVVWNELETLLKNNCHSDGHRSIYNCLHECHKFNNDESDKVELTQALRELDQMGKLETDVQRVSVIRATTDSPMSPPPLASIAPASSGFQARSGDSSAAAKSLYDIFVSRDKPKQRPDFVGAANGGNGSKLYRNLKTDDRGPRDVEVD